MIAKIWMGVAAFFAALAAAAGAAMWWRNRDHVVELARRDRARAIAKGRQALEDLTREVTDDQDEMLADVERDARDHDLNDAIDALRPGSRGPAGSELN